MGDWATDRMYDWADKMVNAAPSRCCIVVGGNLNAHVGYVRHPEREALDLEREVMAGCGEYHQVLANYAKWEHCCEKEDRDAEHLHAKVFFSRVTSLMHHPPSLLTTLRNEL